MLTAGENRRPVDSGRERHVQLRRHRRAGGDARHRHTAGVHIMRS